MPYISLDNLTQYNGRLRDYIDGSFDKLDGANWRKTSAAQSVSCWPIPESPLEPEVAFKFSEVLPESGTKGPDNPSTIVGVESVSCNVCESEGVSDTPYSIDLGGTYYGGTVNFATGVMEVAWASRVFDGSEDFGNPQTLNYVYRFTTSSPVFPSGSVISIDINHEQLSTHFIANGSNSENSQPHFYIASSTGNAIIFSTETSSANLKTWLASQYSAGTPLVMVAKYVVPPTVPLTPVLVRSLPALSHYTPRRNTIYTPHESVQVGYAKSASKTSQDLANAIVALGGNV